MGIFVVAGMLTVLAVFTWLAGGLSYALLEKMLPAFRATGIFARDNKQRFVMPRLIAVVQFVIAGLLVWVGLLQHLVD